MPYATQKEQFKKMTLKTDVDAALFALEVGEGDQTGFTGFLQGPVPRHSPADFAGSGFGMAGTAARMMQVMEA